MLTIEDELDKSIREAEFNLAVALELVDIVLTAFPEFKNGD